MPVFDLLDLGETGAFDSGQFLPSDVGLGNGSYQGDYLNDANVTGGETPNYEYPNYSPYQGRGGLEMSPEQMSMMNPESNNLVRQTGSNLGGNMQTDIMKLLKENPLLLPALIAGAQAVGSSGAAKKSAAMNQQALEAQRARQALIDNPTQASFAGSPGLSPQQLVSNPLAITQSTRYGTSNQVGGLGESKFFNPLKSAHGGPIPGHGALDMAGQAGGDTFVSGHGGGQEDNVPAMLSPKEYVLDSDTVSALGDGNPDHGAIKLDEFRKRLRAHKRSAPASKIPPKALPIETYMRKAA